MINEEYNPVEPNYYNYKGKQYLETEMNRELNTYDNVFVCPYLVNNTEKIPFLRFLLKNSIINKTLNFESVPVFKNFDTDELINFTKVYLFSLLLLNDYKTFNENTDFCGFNEYENNLYLFFDISKFSQEINDNNSNNLCMLLIDEIINHKKMCNIKVVEQVTNFFNFNNYLCFLVDKNEETYEIPIVGYVNKPENKLNFTYTFGETKNNKNGILGPYYYFTNYFNCLKNIEDKNIKQGIIRFALFTGSVKYIENFQNDSIDVSEIKKQRLCDTTINQNLERLTMRITDHDGKWTENYDSVFLGDIELDNGEIFKNHLIVLKEYNQQIPLSFHYITK